MIVWKIITRHHLFSWPSFMFLRLLTQVCEGTLGGRIHLCILTRAWHSWVCLTVEYRLLGCYSWIKLDVYINYGYRNNKNSCKPVIYDPIHKSERTFAYPHHCPYNSLNRRKGVSRSGINMSRLQVTQDVMVLSALPSITNCVYYQYPISFIHRI